MMSQLKKLRDEVKYDKAEHEHTLKEMRRSKKAHCDARAKQRDDTIKMLRDAVVDMTHTDNEYLTEMEKQLNSAMLSRLELRKAVLLRDAKIEELEKRLDSYKASYAEKSDECTALRRKCAEAESTLGTFAREGLIDYEY